MMEIYQIAQPIPLWDIPGMAARAGKKKDAERRAQAMYGRLMALKPDDLSERQWLIQAGVSSSFFTNLKAGSEPSVGNLRLVLEAIGLTLPEFFAAEAKGRLAEVPSEQALASLIDRLLPRLPSVEPDKRSEFLASTLLGVFGLPATMRASAANDYSPAEAGHEATAPSPAPTRKAGSGRRRS